MASRMPLCTRDLGSCNSRYPCDECTTASRRIENGADTMEDYYRKYSGTSGMDKFEGKQIKIIRGSTGRGDRFEFYYGGAMHPDGPGHGHVICNDGETINFWRKPAHEGGQIVINDRYGFNSRERLDDHNF